MTLVLLHPLPLDGSVWTEEMRALAPHTVAPTLYDLGDSIGEWASGVLDLAGPGPLVLVGNSIGGFCALEIARLAPERVRLLALVGAGTGHRPEPDSRDRAIRVLEDQGMIGAWPEYWGPLFAPRANPEVVERARDTALAQPLASIIRGVRVFHGRPDYTEFAESLDAPMLVVRGVHDRIPRDGQALASTLRHGAFSEVDGAGHYVPVERPAQLAAILGKVMLRLWSGPGHGLGAPTYRANVS